MRLTIPYPLQDEDEPFLSDSREVIGQRHCEKKLVPRRKIAPNMRQGKKTSGKRNWIISSISKEQQPVLSRELNPQPQIRASSPVIPDNLTLIDTGDKIVTNRTRKVDSIQTGQTSSRFVPFVPNWRYERRVETTHRTLSVHTIENNSESSPVLAHDTSSRVFFVFILVTVILIFSSLTGQLIEAVKQNTGLK
ncbi:uncharacterized protein LALA0_S08e01002g [Lachancea lanzarotensis]|uniref:LALA0S08e01002g1_1 n=1 Tax=Lachancea lanzarotensis TaxID=1245769 RepID=A0A0C7NCI8_9SACH|nr:uncharacterized protein LALA0_S08e01002g [Lachancea lanzarotensis]CEP63376.1 LALA0S08e01002g1_1 [Lachancea lanzarotensis]